LTSDEVRRIWETMQGQNYFEILGVEETAPTGVLRQRYTELTDEFQLHESHAAGELPSIIRLKEKISSRLATAYRTLMDPKARENYLRQGHKAGGKPGDTSRFRREEVRPRQPSTEKTPSTRRTAESRAILQPTARQQGKAELDKGNYRTATEHLRQALNLSPEDAEAHAWLAQALKELPGRLVEAERHIRQALALDEENPHYLVILGEIQEADGQYIMAKMSFHEALKLDRNMVAATRGLTRVRKQTR
jgi:tetratricopeptide (TPR) repeat protein